MANNNTDEIVDGDNWIFDSLVNFLHGNIWKMPVLGFIEEKSVVFDPDSYSNLSEDKEEEFRKIHEEYKALVDFMLSSFMDDLQVSPEQVEEACLLREKQQAVIPDSHITKMALEQLQAAEDFSVFRRIMTRKNIDLQLQSLELLVAKYGVLSPSLREGDGSGSGPGGKGGGGDEEDDFLQVVLRYCNEDFGCCNCDPAKASMTCTLHNLRKSSPKNQEKTKLRQDEDEEVGSDDEILEMRKRLEKVVKVMGTDDDLTPNTNQSQLMKQDLSADEPSSKVSQDNLKGQSHDDVNKMEQGLILTTAESYGTSSSGDQEDPSNTSRQKGTETKYQKESLGPLKGKKSVKFDPNLLDSQHKVLSSVKKALEVDSPEEGFEGSIPLTQGESGAEGDSEDLEKRRAYLRVQRDKLITLKKRERERQLQQHQQSSSNLQRPKSARAAQMALTSPPPAAVGGDKSLQARRALAARLKQELLGNNPKK